MEPMEKDPTCMWFPWWWNLFTKDPYPPLPLTTPATTHPYYSCHHLPLLPPTTTHSTPTTNNGLERGQVIGNVQMWSRSRRWIQTPPPYHPIPPPTPTTNNGLEKSQFINNVKHGLKRSQ